MEITARQCLRQLARRRVFQQEHLARWQAPEAVVLAASAEPALCSGRGHAASTASPSGAVAGACVGPQHSTGCTGAPRSLLLQTPKRSLAPVMLCVCFSDYLSMSAHVLF